MSEASAGNTTPYRWSGAPKAERKRLLRHSMRDLDKRAGKEISHANEMIDPARTLDNETYINDGKGGFERAESIDQFIDWMDARIAAAKPNTRTYKDGRVVNVALREDAAVMVEYVLQLDPEWTGAWATATPEKRAEIKRLLGVMIAEVIERDGYENVAGWTFNLDETHAHVHMYSVPVDEDGRVNMKAKFDGHSKGAAKRLYVERHDLMRERLVGAGYEATMERVDGGRSHEVLAKFKARKDREKKLDEREASVAQRTIELDEREADLDATEAALDTREATLAARAENLTAKAERLEAQEAALEADWGSDGPKYRAKVAEAEIEALRAVDGQLATAMKAAEDMTGRATRLGLIIDDYNDELHEPKKRAHGIRVSLRQQVQAIDQERVSHLERTQESKTTEPHEIEPPLSAEPVKSAEQQWEDRLAADKARYERLLARISEEPEGDDDDRQPE